MYEGVQGVNLEYRYMDLVATYLTITKGEEQT